MKIELNLNDSVSVVLAKHGARTYNDHFLDLPEKLRPKIMFAGERLETQLHVLFSIFGKLIEIGFDNVPFNGNKIEYERVW